MKNIAKYFLFFLGVFFLFSSCEENTPEVYTGTSLVSFPEDTYGDFIVTDIENPQFIVKVGYINPLSQDQTVKLVIDTEETTVVEGEHFTMPSSISFAAGEVLKDVVITGLFDNLGQKAEKLVFHLEGDNIADFNNKFELTIKKFVPFVPEDFNGTYEVSVTTAALGEASFNVNIALYASKDNLHQYVVSNFYGNPDWSFMIILDEDNNTLEMSPQFIDSQYSRYICVYNDGVKPGKGSFVNGGDKIVIDSYDILEVVDGSATGFIDRAKSSAIFKKVE